MAWFMADKGEVGTAYLYRSAATLVPGRARSSATTTTQPGTRASPSRVRQAWQAAYLHADGTTVADTQAELCAGTVVRPGAGRAAGCRGRTSRRAHPLRRHAPAHGLPLHRRPAAGARRHRPRRRRVRAALPAHRTVVAEHDRPRRHHDLGGLGGHRRRRRRARVAQPLQQGRGDPLPAHPHPRPAPGARLGGLGIRRDRAGPRSLAHVGPRLPRDPAGNHPGRLAHRGRRAPHLGRHSGGDHPPASCSPTAPNRTAGPGSFHGQPQPAASIARPDARGATASTCHDDTHRHERTEDDHFPRALPVGRGNRRPPDRRQQRQQRLVGTRTADARHGAVRRRLRQLPPVRRRHPAAGRRRPDRRTDSASSGRASSRSADTSPGPSSRTTAA